MADDASRRALLVLPEDHDAIALLDKVFRGEEALVEHVEDLEAAVSAMEETYYQAIVVALDRFGGDAVADVGDAIAELEDAEPSSTVVAWVDDREAGRRALQDGADDYVVEGAADEDQLRRIRRYAYERSHLDRALRKSEDKFETLVESIEDGYFEVDLSGTFTYVNDYMSRRSGYEADEMEGTSYVEFVDDDNAEKIFNAFHVLYETGIPLKVLDFEAIRKDGERIDVETSVFLKRDLDGRKIGFWGILRDVTARKQLEAEVEQLRAEPE